jgi:hypothetical protein
LPAPFFRDSSIIESGFRPAWRSSALIAASDVVFKACQSASERSSSGFVAAWPAMASGVGAASAPSAATASFSSV